MKIGRFGNLKIDIDDNSSTIFITGKYSGAFYFFELAKHIESELKSTLLKADKYIKIVPKTEDIEEKYEILKDIIFKDVDFKKDVYFKDCAFKHIVSFEDVKFGKDKDSKYHVNFEGASFAEDVNMSKLEIYHRISFYKSNFSRILDLKDSVFHNMASFDHANIGFLNLCNAKFYDSKNTSFIGMKLKSDIDSMHSFIKNYAVKKFILSKEKYAIFRKQALTTEAKGIHGFLGRLKKNYFVS